MKPPMSRSLHQWKRLQLPTHDQRLHQSLLRNLFLHSPRYRRSLARSPAISLLHRQNIFVIAPQITSFYSALGVSACADFICTLCITNLIEAEHYISIADIPDGFTAIKDRTQGLAAINHVQFLYAHGSIDNFDRRANCRYSIVKEEELLRIISQRASDSLINLIPGTERLAYIFSEKRPILTRVLIRK